MHDMCDVTQRVFYFVGIAHIAFDHLHWKTADAGTARPTPQAGTYFSGPERVQYLNDSATDKSTCAGDEYFLFIRHERVPQMRRARVLQIGSGVRSIAR